MWTQLPLPQRGTAPTQFSAHICCSQMAAWIKMPLGMELGLEPRGLCVRWRPRSTLHKKGAAPAHFYCGQTAACIKMPLGMEVGLSPGDFVLDGDPPLNFRPLFIIVIVISLEHCTMHSRLVCLSSSSSLVFYAFYF